MNKSHRAENKLTAERLEKVEWYNKHNTDRFNKRIYIVTVNRNERIQTEHRWQTEMAAWGEGGVGGG